MLKNARYASLLHTICPSQARRLLTRLDCFQPYEEVSAKDVARFKQEMDVYRGQQPGRN